MLDFSTLEHLSRLYQTPSIVSAVREASKYTRYMLVDPVNKVFIPK